MARLAAGQLERPRGHLRRLWVVRREHPELRADLQVGRVDGTEAPDHLGVGAPLHALDPAEGGTMCLPGVDDIVGGQGLAVAPGQAGQQFDVDGHRAAGRHLDVAVLHGRHLAHQVRVRLQAGIHAPQPRVQGLVSLPRRHQHDERR